MGISRIFGLCFALLFASSVGAVTIDLGPSDYRSFGPNGSHTSSGIRSSVGQTVRMPPVVSGPTRILPVARNPIVPYAGAAAAMRPFTGIHPVSVAASAAITGMFVAMEWYFDEEIGEWSVREEVDAPPDVQTGVWIPAGGWDPSATGLTFPSAQTACRELVGVYQGGQNNLWSNGSAVGLPSGQTACRGDRLGVPNSANLGFVSNPDPTCPVGYEYSHERAICYGEESVPVIEGEFTRLAGELPSFDPNTVSEGTGDAMRRQGAPASGYHDSTITGPDSTSGDPVTTTSTNTETGSTTTTSSTTTTNYDYGTTTITSTETTVTNTFVDGQHTSTEQSTTGTGDLPVEAPGSGVGSLEFPPFCDWATVVCDWLDWTQEDPGLEDPDLPVPIDEDYSEQKNISFGAKSCPPDYEVNIALLNTTVSVPFQPLCDFAGIIYYMVMAAAYIIAAYISIGVARNG